MQCRNRSAGDTDCIGDSSARAASTLQLQHVVVGFALNFFSAINPVKALFYSAVLNGVVAVPLLIVLMLVCNNRKIVKERVNGPVSNILGWLTVVLMGLAVSFMFWAMATGHTS